MTRRIRVLNPCSAWGGGHIQTCINLVRGMARAGADVHLHLLRSRVDMTDVPHSPTVPRLLAPIGLRKWEKARRRRTEARFLSQLRPGDITWIWPLVSLETYREIRRRGNPIIMEGINSRMGSARRILDRVYAEAGLPAGHGITEAKIATEEEMLSMATHFFAPNPGVEAALVEPDCAFDGQILPTSYGAWMPAEPPPEKGQAEAPVTVIFVGRVCLRKNGHGLLQAWQKLNPASARLLLCGSVDQEIADLCREALAMPSVSAPGHVSDMAAAYRQADVFVMPSFEEGGPQVTYEAASHGLPVITSFMGAGRMQAHEGAALMIDPHDVSDMADKIGRLIEDSAQRAHYAARAYAVVPQYDWNAVGRQRVEALREVFGDV